MKDWDSELPAAAYSCYSISAIVRSAIGLMTAGNSSYADLQKFHSDFLFRETPKQARPGKLICRSVGGYRSPADFPRYSGFMVVEAIERTVPANGQALLIPAIELSSWWINPPYFVRQCTAPYRAMVPARSSTANSRATWELSFSQAGT